MLKIGLDIHGVIDTYPNYFSDLSKTFVQNGFEVHIITGNKKTNNIIKQLKSYDIKYNHFFSISDYLIELGKDCTYSSPDNPWFDDEIWISQKGEYAKRVNLNIHFDDFLEYKMYFPKTTMFCHVK